MWCPSPLLQRLEHLTVSDYYPVLEYCRWVGQVGRGGLVGTGVGWVDGLVGGVCGCGFIPYWLVHWLCSDTEDGVPSSPVKHEDASLPTAIKEANVEYQVPSVHSSLLSFHPDPAPSPLLSSTGLSSSSASLL